ncbi:MAG: hypothetical protein ACYTF6_09255 [Planctomycetota bacterium]|jgi:hypothetical protein
MRREDEENSFDEVENPSPEDLDIEGAEANGGDFDYDQDEDQREALDYREDFRRVLRGDWITGFLAVNAAGAFVWAIFGPGWQRPVLITAGIVAAVAAVGFNHINWRCPSCNNRVARDVGTHCPHCAARLR